MNPVIAEISRDAIRHNLAQVKQLAPKSKVLAMVKADGYGFGLIEMAKTLHDVDAFGVARTNEALLLRQAGINNSIVLMEGCFSLEELHLAQQHGFQIVIQNQMQLDLFLNTQLSSPVKVWLKVDTGMHRLGFALDSIMTAYNQLKRCQHADSEMVLLTHFACADEAQNPKNKEQLELFEEIVQQTDCLYSAANSAAIMTNTKSHYDWVRPGIMLYGSSPIANSNALKDGLKPAMTLKSVVIAVNRVQKGGSVGYGANWVAEQDTYVAVVAMGYGDGYPRHAKNGTPVMINDICYPMVGRVSMDMLTVNIGNDSNVKIGDPVVLWGNELMAEDVAASAETISYEMYCNMSSRVQKRFS